MDDTPAGQVAAAVAGVAETFLLRSVDATASRDQLIAAARSPCVTGTVADRLLKRGNAGVVADLADNPACGPSMLAVLFDYEDADVRQSVEMNPRTPFALIAARGERSLVHHPDCPAFVLADTFRSKSTARRGLALRHAALPADLRAQASRERSDYTAIQLLTNPALTQVEADVLLDRYPGRDQFHLPARWAGHRNADPAWLADTYGRYRFVSAVVAPLAANPARCSTRSRPASCTSGPSPRTRTCRWR